MATKYFVAPFALNGDRTAIPDAVQPDGSVSFDSGWGFDYERNPDPVIDPLTKDVERDKMNQVLFDITDNLKQLQDFGGAPEWSSVRGAVGYPRDAKVTHTGIIYTSTINSNTLVPGAVGSETAWVIGVTLDQTLQSIAALTGVANTMIYFTGVDVAQLTDLTSLGRSLIGQVSAAGGRSVLGIISATNAAEGLIRQATQGEVNAGTAGNMAVTPSTMFNGFSRFGNLTAGGMNYPQWMGAHQRRWGVVTVPGNTTNFPVASLHSNQCQNVIVSLGFNAGGDYQPPKATPSGTGISISNSDSNNLQVRYLTEGY